MVRLGTDIGHRRDRGGQPTTMTGVLTTKRHFRAEGDAVEAIFCVTAILLLLTIDLVMIVLA